MGTPRARPRVPRSSPLWSMLVSLLVVVVALEAGLRLFGPFLPGSYRTGPQIEPDTALGWHNIPGSETWFRRPEFTQRVIVDADGRIASPVPTPAPSGPRRVLLLGDSFLAGEQVPYEASVTARLGLALSGSGTGVRMVNDGVPGYGTDQEVLLLERELGTTRPDAVVILLALANDVWNNDWAFEQTAPTAPKPYFEIGPDGRLALHVIGEPTLGARLASFVARSSALLSTLKSGIVDNLTMRDRTVRPRQLDLLVEPTGEWTRAWKLTELILDRAASDAARAGVPLVLVIIPDPCQVYADSCAGHPELAASDVPQRRLAAAAPPGVTLVDLLPAFRAQRDATRLFYAQDLHFTSAGHAATARELAPVMSRLLRP